MTTPTQAFLLQDEQIRHQAQFSPNLILTHLKTTLVVTDRRVIVNHPNTVFGVFPKGYTESTSALSDISEVTTGEIHSGREMTYGVGACLVGVMMLFLGIMGSAASFVFGLVLLIVGALLIIGAGSTGISFLNTGGGRLVAVGGKNDRHHVEAAGREVTRLLFSLPTPGSLDRPGD